MTESSPALKKPVANAAAKKTTAKKSAVGKKAAVKTGAAKPAAANKAGPKSTAAKTAPAPATEQAAEKPAAEKPAAEKAAAEKPAAEKAAAEKVAAEKAAVEKAAAEKAVAEKAVAEKAAAEKSAAEKSAAEAADAEAAEDDDDASEGRLIQEARVWQDDGWTARVMKNEDDDGWAVAMTLDGEPEPALVGPWTMGRDKKNPKPLDANAFSVLVKTAFEVRRRHEQQLHAMLHKSVSVDSNEGRMKVSLQIVPDEYEPHAFLRAHDDFGDLVAEVKVEANFKLNNASANRWIDNAFRRPGGD